MKRSIATLALMLGACSVTPDRAIWPDAWEAGDVLPIQSIGRWYQASKGYEIGPYQVEKVDGSWWDTVPASSGFSIGFGGGRSGVVIGGETIHDESEFGFRVKAQGVDLNAVRCQQFLHVENWHGGLGDVNIGEIIVQGNLAYLAKLNCEAVGFHPEFPAWSLDLRAVDQRPFFGVLTVAGETWAVAGTQEATFGSYDRITGYEIRRGEDILARLDRLQDGSLQLVGEISTRERLALLAAAGSLIFANDPLARAN